MRKVFGLLAASVALVGCQTTGSYSAMEKHLNRYAGAEVIANNCPAGGYGSISQMRTDAEANLQKARALGATSADVQKARQRVLNQFQGAVFMYGQYPACNSMVNQLAWVGTTPATSDPKPKPKPAS